MSVGKDSGKEINLIIVIKKHSPTREKMKYLIRIIKLLSKIDVNEI